MTLQIDKLFEVAIPGIDVQSAGDALIVVLNRLNEIDHPLFTFVMKNTDECVLEARCGTIRLSEIHAKHMVAELKADGFEPTMAPVREATPEERAQVRTNFIKRVVD